MLIEDLAALGLVLRAELQRYLADPERNAESGSRVGTLCAHRRASLTVLGLSPTQAKEIDLSDYLSRRAKELKRSNSVRQREARQREQRQREAEAACLGPSEPPSEATVPPPEGELDLGPIDVVAGLQRVPESWDTKL